ncbi:hypothetical protein G9A89_015900 [Geosiphon pyriformis]|nr:hypothetical protein G9A89_015900 [Geosiphon pyriformis]
MPKESNFQQIALFKDEITVPRSNSSNNTIPPAQIAQNGNLSNIFPFEFEANKLPFLLSNIAVNKQKAITAMYTKAKILDQFITGLKDKLIKKVHPHVSEDLATAIKHTKNYELAIEKANHIKLVNLAIRETSLAAEEKINQLTRKIENYFIKQSKPKPNYYHTQSSYLTIPKESDFQQTVLSEDKVAAPRLNPFNNTIPPAQIAQNANLSDILLFEFKANESPFLLSNTAVNEQKTITAIYTKAKVERKPIQLILDIIVTADNIKKTPVGEINNFPFTINEITISIKVLANANLDWKTQKLKISYQEQYTRVLVICGTFNKKSEKVPVFEFKEKKELSITKTFMALELPFNWAKETEQKIFEKTRKLNIVRYSTPESRKQPPYIPLKCKDYKKKLLSMRACIFSEEEYETCTCYFCKTCHRKRFGYPKKIRRETPFNTAYNNALNKLYHYSYDAKIIFNLIIALINEIIQENVHQIKKAKYIEYTIELAEFNYKDKCPEYYALSILLFSKDDQEEIEFGEHKPEKKIATTLIYLTENQSAIQLKYFNNNEKGIKPEKAYEIDAGYDLRYSNKDTLVLQPKSTSELLLKYHQKQWYKLLFNYHWQAKKLMSEKKS